MVRSMFTAIGGLRNHQVMLDVTANNIANVNTVGYKAQRVAFESMMAQILRGAAAPRGGRHRRHRPDRRSASAWRSTRSARCSRRARCRRPASGRTWRSHGDGYFVVASRPRRSDRRAGRRADIAVHARRQLHRRQGRLTSSTSAASTSSASGAGTARTAADPSTHDARRASTSRSTRSRSRSTRTASSRTTTRRASRSRGRSRSPSSRTRPAWPASPDNLKATAELGHLRPDQPDRHHDGGNVLWGEPNTQGRGSITSGRLEMSNVDLALRSSPTMITAQRGFQANTRVDHDLGRDARRARQHQALVAGQSAAVTYRYRRRPPRARRARRPARAGPTRRVHVRPDVRHSQAEENRSMIKLHHGREGRAPGLGQRRPDRDRGGDAGHRRHADHGPQADRHGDARRDRRARRGVPARVASRPSRSDRRLTIERRDEPAAANGYEARMDPGTIIGIVLGHRRRLAAASSWRAATRRLHHPAAVPARDAGHPRRHDGVRRAEAVLRIPKLYIMAFKGTPIDRPRRSARSSHGRARPPRGPAGARGGGADVDDPFI